MKPHTLVYKSYLINRHILPNRTYRYTVEHPYFGDVWFETLKNAKGWIDEGCPQFGKLQSVKR